MGQDEAKEQKPVGQALPAPRDFLGGYTFSEGEWKPVDTIDEPLSGIKKWSILTYNVWFVQESEELRYGEILKLMKQHDPDVMCLQEVTTTFLEVLVAVDWVKESYHISTLTDKDFSGWYGVCIISKHPIKSLKRYNLPSRMGRDLLVAQYQVNEQVLTCATVHLESMDTRETRHQQLQIMKSIVEPFGDCFVVGDFNFDSEINWAQLEKETVAKDKLADLSIPYPPDNCECENVNLKNTLTEKDNWTDLWPKLRPEEKGKTFDSVANTMLDHFEQMRYDRILFRSVSGNWTPTSIELVGTQKIGDYVNSRNRPLFPSDHFGLYAEITWNK